MRVTQAGLVTPSSMKRAIIAVFANRLFVRLLPHLSRRPRHRHRARTFTSHSVILYTAGPYPLAYLGLGDIFVLLLYGPGAVLITYYLQTGNLSTDVLIAGPSPGAISMAILVVNNVRDID